MNGAGHAKIHYLKSEQVILVIFQAYAYCYLGESFLAQDKCGDAVRCCTEGVAEYKIACDFTTKYANASGPGWFLSFSFRIYVYF